MNKPRTFTMPLMVHFDDVDMGGVVHHPTYFKYYERARTELLLEVGYDFKRMLSEGISIALVEANIRYRKPARYQQKLWVVSRVVEVRKARIRFLQALINQPPVDDEIQALGEDLEKSAGLINFADLKLACIDMEKFRPIAVPELIRNSLGFQ